MTLFQLIYSVLGFAIWVNCELTLAAHVSPKIEDQVNNGTRGEAKFSWCNGCDQEGINYKSLSASKVRESYRKMAYPFRSAIYYRMLELEEELRNGVHKPFNKVVNTASITSGPQLKPNTFLRQLISLVSYPELMSSSTTVFPSDVRQRAEDILLEIKENDDGIIPDGLSLVRNQVTQFIFERDGIQSNVNDIILTNGVSDGLALAFQLLQLECKELPAGVLVPIPLYSLYSSLLTKFDLRQINYHLNPDKNWETEVNELERTYNEAVSTCNCYPRAIVLINPGNPTGRVLKRKSIEKIIRFAYSRNLVIVADEVFQLTTLSDLPFVAIKKVVIAMEHPFNMVELISFNSISKGFTNEPALRGGYMELLNLDPRIRKIIVQLLSVKQCPNMMGQSGVYAMTNPPTTWEPSYPQFEDEKRAIFRNRALIAKQMVQALNDIPGFQQAPLEASFVVFPKISIPIKAIMAAGEAGLYPDVFYAFELLDTTGYYVEVGSSYGLPANLFRLKLVIPTSLDKVGEFAEVLKSFHGRFMRKYS